VFRSKYTACTRGRRLFQGSVAFFLADRLTCLRWEARRTMMKESDDEPHVYTTNMPCEKRLEYPCVSALFPCRYWSDGQKGKGKKARHWFWSPHSTYGGISIPYTVYILQLLFKYFNKLKDNSDRTLKYYYYYIGGANYEMSLVVCGRIHTWEKVGKGKEQGKRDAAISMVSKAKHAYVMCNETIEWTRSGRDQIHGCLHLCWHACTSYAQ
jgi:hypothetical protein